MKTWRIPVVWQEMAVINIDANTLAEAVEIAKDDEGVIPLPTNSQFLDGSWEVDCDSIAILRETYNDNQEDEKPVEMAPVIHAHWKPGKAYPSEYFCSYCGELWNDVKTKRCHECGAVMDLKSEDMDE